MYFWNICKLKDDLLHEKVDEKQTFLYILCWTTAWSLLLCIVVLFPTENPNLWDQLVGWFTVIATIIGTICVFNANGAANGSDFAKRYFSIGWVVGIRCLVIFLLLIFAFVFLLALLGVYDENVATTWIDALISASIVVLVYWRCVRHVSNVVARKSAYGNSLTKESLQQGP